MVCVCRDCSTPTGRSPPLSSWDENTYKQEHSSRATDGRCGCGCRIPAESVCHGGGGAGTRHPYLSAVRDRWYRGLGISIAVKISVGGSAGLHDAVRRLRRGLRDVRDRMARRWRRWRGSASPAWSAVITLHWCWSPARTRSARGAGCAVPSLAGCGGEGVGARGTDRGDVARRCCRFWAVPQRC